MGLLDDAIREHLDLKRRRGADPSEIEQAEREALGPVRRGPEDMEDADALEAGVGLAEQPQGYEDESHEPWEDSFEDETQLFDEQPAPSFGHVPASEDFDPAPPMGSEPEIEDEFATRPHQLEPEPLDPEPHEPAPEPPAGPPAATEPPIQPPAPAGLPPAESPPAESPSLQPETAEHDVEGEPGTEADDVLEETPEFLQDTPDHDRLWFEQRPPRDFDFDG